MDVKVYVRDSLPLCGPLLSRIAEKGLLYLTEHNLNVSFCLVDRISCWYNNTHKTKDSETLSFAVPCSAYHANVMQKQIDFLENDFNLRQAYSYKTTYSRS